MTEAILNVNSSADVNVNTSVVSMMALILTFALGIVLSLRVESSATSNSKQSIPRAEQRGVLDVGRGAPRTWSCP